MATVSILDMLDFCLCPGSTPGSEKQSLLREDTGQEPPKHTVVVGGGIIGLCTAFQLAVSARASGAVDKITVVEAGPDVFGAASSHNSASIHYNFNTFPRSVLAPLGKFSCQLLQAIDAHRPDFRAQTGFRPDSYFLVDHGEDGDKSAAELLPEWVRTDAGWKAKLGGRGKDHLTVNPKALGTWLKNECVALGVKVRTSATAVKAGLSKGAIDSVTLVSSGKAEELPCDNLVVAAGPWTAQQMRILFPDSTLDLKSVVVGLDWLVLENDLPPTRATSGTVVFDRLVGEILDFAGRSDGTIFVCGHSRTGGELPPVGENPCPDKESVGGLLAHSRRFVRHGEADGGLRVLDKGRSFKPVTESALPVLSHVPARLLSGVGGAGEGPGRSGVCVAFGHESQGMCLAMGTGRVMAQLVRGEEPDVDISMFAIR